MSTRPPILLLVVASVLAGAGALSAGSDVCTSPKFREAFLEGQIDVRIDYTTPSPHLVAMGNQVLPCLVEIAEHGGHVLGISRCVDGQYGCQGWALAAVRMIGTPEARQYLIENLNPDRERYQIQIAVREVGILREPGARPGLRKLLKHSDSEIRLESIVSLAAIGDRSDFDVMLKTAILLPDEKLRAAANGFRILGDPRAFEPLEKRIGNIKDPEIRRWAERVLTDWRSQIAEEKRVLTILRTGFGEDLYKSIRTLKIQSDEIRKALLELLGREDARTRAESVRALARFNVASDFGRLLEVTLALPCTYVLIGAQGIERFNDPRAIEPLEEYASGMKNRARQRELAAVAERLRRHTAVAEAP